MVNNAAVAWEIKLITPRLANSPLWVRLGIPISLVIALAIGLISFLNYYVYEKTYKDLNVSRVTVVARDLRQAIEGGLNVGLAPSSSPLLDDALVVARDHTEGLRFAVIIDEAVRRLVTVGRTAESQDWSTRLQAGDWIGEDADTYQVGLPYKNSFGVVVGAVILGYDKAAVEVATSTMRASLLMDWLRAVTATSLLTLLGVRWLARDLERELNDAGQALDLALSAENARDVRLPVLGESVESGLAGFIKGTHALAQQLAAAPTERSRS